MVGEDVPDDDEDEEDDDELPELDDVFFLRLVPDEEDEDDEDDEDDDEPGFLWWLEDPELLPEPEPDDEPEPPEDEDDEDEDDECEPEPPDTGSPFVRIFIFEGLPSSPRVITRILPSVMSLMFTPLTDDRSTVISSPELSAVNS